MYVHARRVLGLSPDQFWDLTIREYSRECTAAAGRARDRYNLQVSQAWQTIAFLGQSMSSQGLSRLDKFLQLEPGERDRPQSLTYAEVENFVISHGLKKRPISAAAKDAMRRMKADMPRNKAMAEQAIAEARMRRN